jgi:arylsulfatase A-like enzyme
MRTGILTALIAIGASSCGRDAARPNIVVIVMDTARPDFLSAYGHPRPTTPFLDELAKHSTRYDRAYSTSSWTLPAHASLFSGEPPEVHHTAQANTKFPAELPLLAEQLAAAGYQTAGFSNNPWVSATSGLDRGFESFVDRWRAGAGVERPVGQPTVSAVDDWIAKQRDTERPAFVFVNLTEPHMPYRPPWEFTQEFFGTEPEWRRAMDGLFPPRTNPAALMVRHYSRVDPLSEADWPQLSGLYEGELRSCDDVVRRIVESLDGALDPENTLLFVLSDHGENLGDHDHVNHVFNLYESNVRIALIARGPGFDRGAHEKRLAQITDLHPTSLAAAGLAQTGSHAAFDLRAGMRDERVLRTSLEYPKISLSVFPEPIQHSGGPLDRYKRALSAAVTSRWKLIRASDGTVEAYDLLADPNETNPLDLERLEPRVFAALQAFLDQTDDARSGRDLEGAGDLPTDPATLDALRSLGYTR